MRTPASIAALGAAFTACIAFAADDAVRGKTTYEANCAACHTVTPGKQGFGPSLAGVVGRDAGTLEGYKFSSAMSQSGLRWDAKNLDEFLAASTKKDRGRAMDVADPTLSARAAV